MEKIICSAIHFDDGKEYVHSPKNITSGFVICGRRHHNCFAILGQVLRPEKDYKQIDEVQGFITNTDRFVDREEAYQIALNSNQIINPKSYGIPSKLYSEDLY